MNGVSETRNPNKSASFKLIFSSVLSLWWKKNNKWSVHSLHKHTYRSHVRWPDPASGRRTQEDQEFKVIFGYIASSRSALGYIRPCLRNKTAQPSKEISTIKDGRKSISLLLTGNIFDIVPSRLCPLSMSVVGEFLFVCFLTSPCWNNRQTHFVRIYTKVTSCSSFINHKTPNSLSFP